MPAQLSKDDLAAAPVAPKSTREVRPAPLETSPVLAHLEALLAVVHAWLMQTAVDHQKKSPLYPAGSCLMTSSQLRRTYIFLPWTNITAIWTGSTHVYDMAVYLGAVAFGHVVSLQ